MRLEGASASLWGWRNVWSTNGERLRCPTIDVVLLDDAQAKWLFTSTDGRIKKKRARHTTVSNIKKSFSDFSPCGKAVLYHSDGGSQAISTIEEWNSVMRPCSASHGSRPAALTPDMSGEGLCMVEATYLRGKGVILSAEHYERLGSEKHAEDLVKALTRCYVMGVERVSGVVINELLLSVWYKVNSLPTDEGQARAPLPEVWIDRVYQVDLEDGHIQTDTGSARPEVPAGSPSSARSMAADDRSLSSALNKVRAGPSCRGDLCGYDSEAEEHFMANDRLRAQSAEGGDEELPARGCAVYGLPWKSVLLARIEGRQVISSEATGVQEQAAAIWGPQLRHFWLRVRPASLGPEPDCGQGVRDLRRVDPFVLYRHVLTCAACYRAYTELDRARRARQEGRRKSGGSIASPLDTLKQSFSLPKLSNRLQQRQRLHNRGLLQARERLGKASDVTRPYSGEPSRAVEQAPQTAKRERAAKHQRRQSLVDRVKTDYVSMAADDMASAFVKRIRHGEAAAAVQRRLAQRAHTAEVEPAGPVPARPPIMAPAKSDIDPRLLQLPRSEALDVIMGRRQLPYQRKKRKGRTLAPLPRRTWNPDSLLHPWQAEMSRERRSSRDKALIGAASQDRHDSLRAEPAASDCGLAAALQTELPSAAGSDPVDIEIEDAAATTAWSYADMRSHSGIDSGRSSRSSSSNGIGWRQVVEMEAFRRALAVDSPT